eukprot:TRINITY_DN2085_c0_g1_i1.p1 TRINITY_DN2085_c0_g1~~TRINITY_DN2085_c0_g1_i1.p1  ORF type:complete len:122 (-),score=36.95 TRINITY_DN2085_c0_g1_i1:392-757(-)
MASVLKLFSGGQPKKQQVNPQQTIENLRGTLDMLEKRENYLESKIQKELQVAKQQSTKNKKLALMALKRKKAYEAQIEKLGGARSTMETMILAIESATTNLAALTGMTEGARAIRILNNNM